MADYAPEDYADYPDERDPIAETASTMALIQQMKQEEAAAAAPPPRNYAPPPPVPQQFGPPSPGFGIPLAPPPPPVQSQPMAIPGPGIPLAPQPTVQSAPALPPGGTVAPEPPVQSAPMLPPGGALTPPPPVQSAPVDAAGAYQAAAQGGRGPAADVAWSQLVASGQRPTTAAIYPPSQPQTKPMSWVNRAQPVPEPTIPSPAQQQFEAQQQIQRAIDRGMQPADALRLYGSALMATTAAAQKPMTPFQQAEVARWNQPKVMSPYQQAQVNRWQGADTAKATASQKAALQKDIRAMQAKMAAGELASPDSDNPKIAGSAKAKANAALLKSWQDQLRSLETPAPVTAGTATTPVRPPTGVKTAAPTSGRVRVKNPDGKIGTIPAAQLDEALAAGWTQM